MLAFAISLLLGLITFGALAVIADSTRTAIGQARAIRLELRMIQRPSPEGVSRPLRAHPAYAEWDQPLFEPA